MRRIGQVITVTLGCVLATTAAAIAQHVGGTGRLTEMAIDGAVPMTRADARHEEAVALHARPDRFYQAALLHKEEAAMRPAGDPKAVECLSVAAHLLMYSGHVPEARRTMEAAAGLALDRGDVVRAAQAFLHAAFIAGEQHKPRDVARLVGRAQRLAQSPLLTAPQRIAILEQVTARARASALR